MRKVFLGEIKNVYHYYENYDEFLNISEERYFEVDDETFEKLEWWCKNNNEGYVLIEWIEKDSKPYVSILEKVESAWKKEQAKREAKAKEAAERKAKSEETARKRKLRQLEKLKKELEE